MTVGTVMPMRNALRPGAGSAWSVCRSSEAPVDAFDVSMIGDWPVTVIDSSIAPISSLTSSVMNCCVPTVRPFDSYRL